MIPELDRIYVGDCMEIMRAWPDAFIQTVVTSPPYWGLRDYKTVGQLGLEISPEAYVKKMTEVFRKIRRVLRDDGTLWLNLGDSYNSTNGFGRCKTQFYRQGRKGGSADKKEVPSLKTKDMIGIPWRMAFALQADGWYLRSDIIWAKPNPMPESVTDRPTKAHEYLFLLAKSERYFYDAEAIKELTTYPDLTEHGSQIFSRAYPNRAQISKWKTPDGWDTSTGNGGHGSFHKDGREKGFKGYKDLPDGQIHIRKVRDKQRGHSRRHDGLNDRWDAMDKATQCSMMRNKRSIWTVATSPFPQAHFATFPPDLIKPCILAGSRAGDVVLDPFMGAGTTGLVAAQYDRRFLGVELNPEYVTMANQRIATELAQVKMALT